MAYQVYELGKMAGSSRKGISPADIRYNHNLASRLASIGAENTYGVTHMSDLDGISSAALLFKFYSVPLDHIYFTDYKVDTIRSIAESIESLGLHGAAIIISDFSSNQANTEVIVEFLSKQRDRGNFLIWLDHHPWTEDAIASISPLLDFGIAGENNEYCATEIIYRVLCEDKDGDGAGKEIAYKAHMADFNLALPPPLGDTAPNTGLAINYYTHAATEKLYGGLQGFVKDVAKLDYASEGFADATNRYRQIAEAEFDSLKKGMKQIDLYGIKTVIGFGRFMHATATCGMLHELTGADMVIYVRIDENEVSMRSWGEVDCSKIAFKMHGGGHPPPRHSG